MEQAGIVPYLGSALLSSLPLCVLFCAHIVTSCGAFGISRPGYRSMAERFHVAPKTPHGDIPQPQGHDRLSREPAPMVASEVGLVSSHDAAGPRDTSAPLLELLEGDASFQDTHTDSVLAYSDVVPEFSGEVGADLESDGPGNSKREEGAEGQLPADQVLPTVHACL